jgi:hypothetical protein
LTFEVKDRAREEWLSVFGKEKMARNEKGCEGGGGEEEERRRDPLNYFVTY